MQNMKKFDPKKFVEYITEWEELQYKYHNMHWIFKRVLYLPIGAIMEHILLNKMHRLTEEYNDYLQKLGI